MSSEPAAPPTPAAAVPPEAAAGETYGSRGERGAWVLFDFANSPFVTLLVTVFGGPYFTQVLVGPAGLDLGVVTLAPKTAWGWALGLSMLAVTVTSPVLGRLADRRGWKRRFLAGYVLLTVAATVGLSLLPPGAGIPAFLLYVLANFGFEGAYVFYNAFLPQLAPPHRVGRLSGWAWGIGYAGGLIALIAVGPLTPETLDAVGAGAGNVPGIYLVVAAWYLLFSAPALLFLKDRPPATRPDGEASSEAGAAVVGNLRAIVAGLRARPAIAFFLAAFFLYNDALTTVIHFTAIYTDEVLAFTPEDTRFLFIVMNVVALPGAIGFGFLQDRIGGLWTLRINLLIWIAVVIVAVLAQSKGDFWPAAFLAATVIGATQSASRALMARLAPADRVGEYMGLLALSGKGSSALGPILYGTIASAFATAADPAAGNRIAVGLLGGFFLVGLFLLGRVREPPRHDRRAPPMSPSPPR